MVSRIITMGATSSDVELLSSALPDADLVDPPGHGDELTLVFEAGVDETLQQILTARGDAAVVVVTGDPEGARQAGAVEALSAAELAEPGLASRLALAQRLARAEARLRADRARASARVHENSDFTRLVAHDLRGAMSTVGLACDVLKTTLDGAAGTKYVATIERAIGRADRMLDEAGELAAIETDRVALESVDTDLCAVARSVASQVAEDATASRVELSVRTPEDAATVRVDRERLTRAVALLVRRVCVHARGTAVEIVVQPGADDVELAVLAPDLEVEQTELARVFAPAWRGPRGTGSLEPGAALARLVVERSGGSVAATPAERGTRFALRLPRHA